MPSQRPSAAFDPIPPDLDLPALVEETPNFEYVTRVSCDMIEAQSMEAFEKLVLLHVIIGGKPLVIEGFQHRLDEWTFTSQWLKDNCGSKFENARNLIKQQNLPLSIGHYLDNLSKLSNQWTPTNYRESDRQRIYLKDIDCPELWHEKLEEQIPPAIFYLNESTGEVGGPGAPDVIPTQTSGHTKGKGVARAGDLMSSLPPSMRADNMMCYIGHEGTYTPAHREMCASLGQNLMVETSGPVDADGKPDKPGSSIWFMTETNDRHLVSEYWLSTLGHDIEVEKHFAQINAWKAAPFTTYIVEQKVGDFILIPPLAPHQVWNRGTRTMKVAWNRTTVETLELALHEALPRARMVCRDEQYKNKAIVYFTLQKYSSLLNRIEVLKQQEPDEQVVMDLTYNNKIRQLQKDFRRLFALYTEILLSETLAPVSHNEKRGQYLPYDGFVTCSYCRCNIFNRFLTCETCIEPLENGEESTYDICMECFAMGRSCACISDYKWVEQFPWQELTERYDQWRHQIIALDGGVNERSPRSLQREKKNLGKKTLAQVCQEQLKIRPWNDPKNPKPAMTTAALSKARRVELDEDGDPIPGKTPKKGKAGLERGMVMEHVSCYPREAWKCAKCSKCDRSFQYGSMWRMFDIMPQTVMEQLEWECPACEKRCSCGSCRRKADNIPYEPRGTVLGHDTKKVADVRSVESLVDFSHSNLHHIKKIGDDDPHDSRRLGRRIDEAARAKAQDPTLDDNYVDEDDVEPAHEQFYENGIRFITGPDIPIDPMLSMGQPAVPTTQNAFDSPHNQVPTRRRGSESDAERKRAQHPGKKKNKAKQNALAKTNGSRPGDDATFGHNDHLDAADGNSAPVANMGGQNQSYQYPDPSLPGLDNGSPLSYFASSKTPRTEQNLQGTSQFRQAQVKQSLQEAKRNNRHTIAEAALQGKRLPVTLKVGRIGMALITDRLSEQRLAEPTHDPAVDKDLLQSDMPSPKQPQKPLATSKKRKVREEELDDDFSTRKRKDRKSYLAQAVKKPQKQPYEDFTDGTSSEADLVETSFAAVNKPRGPRKLPKYLADQHEDGDFPAELPPEPLRRRPSQGEKHNGSLLGQALNSATPNDSNAASGSLSSAQKLAEENRKAKRKAILWADGAGGSQSSDSDKMSDPESPQKSILGKATSVLKKVPQSMLSRMGGRKIKVVGAKPKTAAVNGVGKR